MLNQIEAALLKARGYSKPVIVHLTDKDVVARSYKGHLRAEALGRNELDATRKLVAVVTRR